MYIENHSLSEWQSVEKVHSQKIIHKKFSPAFFKRRWGRGAKPLSSSAEDEIFPCKERRREQEAALPAGVCRCAANIPGGTFVAQRRTS